jgi:hypothetical protein
MIVLTLIVVYTVVKKPWTTGPTPGRTGELYMIVVTLKTTRCTQWPKKQKVPLSVTGTLRSVDSRPSRCTCTSTSSLS